MTDKEILEKAIQKAIDGGWTAELLGGKETWEDVNDYPLMKEQLIKAFLGNEDAPDGYRLIIFNHDFAKALWGEEAKYPVAFEKTEDYGEAWQYHLQQMVIAEDPIAYLGENI